METIFKAKKLHGLPKNCIHPSDLKSQPYTGSCLEVFIETNSTSCGHLKYTIINNKNCKLHTYQTRMQVTEQLVDSVMSCLAEV